MGKFSGLRNLVNTGEIVQALEASGATFQQQPATIDEALQQAEAPELQVQVNQVLPASWKLYYEEAKVLSLMESIQQLGQIDAVAVVRLPDGSYQVLAGNHRLEAVKRLADRPLRIKVFDLSPSMALDIAIASNAQRSDPNPLELVQLILSSLSSKLEIPQDEVIQWFYRFGNDKQNVLLTPEWRIISDTFAAVCPFSPSTFRVDYLRLLSLPEPVLNAIKTGALTDHTKAKAIAKLRHDPDAMAALLHEAIANPLLSVREIAERVKQDKPQREPAVWRQVSAVEQRIKARKEVLQDPKVRGRIEKAIAAFEKKVDEILGQEDFR